MGFHNATPTGTSASRLTIEVDSQTGANDPAKLAAAITAAVSAIAGGANGVVVQLANHSYAWSAGSVPAIPSALAGLVKIKGAGIDATTIVLSSTVPRFLDLSGNAATVQNVTIEDLTVDASALPVNTSTGHGIIGTMRGGIGGADAQNASLKDITIRRVRGVGGPVNTDGTHQFFWIGLQSAVAFNGSQQSVQRITIEDIDLGDGDNGVYVGGVPSSGAYANVLVDEVRVHRWRHTITATPSAFFGSNHVIVGHHGFGGRCSVVDGYGTNCGDMGIEIDAMADATVERVRIEDSWSAAFFHTNLGPAASTDQVVRFIGCKARRTNLAADNNHGRGIQTTYTTTYGAAHKLVVRDFAWYRKTAELALLGEAAFISGHALVDIDGFHSTTESINTTDATVYSTAALNINIPTAQPMVLTANRLYASLAGTKGAGAGSTIWFPFNIDGVGGNGVCSFDIRNVGYDFNVTSAQAGMCRGLRLQEGALSGTIRRYRPGTITGDTQPRGLMVNPNTSITVQGQILFEDMDFRQMSVGTDIWWGTANGSSPADDGFFLRNVKWRGSGFPRANSAITVSASPFDYKNADGTQERVFVRGGTVSKVEHSVDGTTWVDTGVVAGPFFLEPSEHLRVTYTVAPAMSTTWLR